MANNLHQASEKIVADMEQLKETPLAQFQTPRANSWWRVLLTGLLFLVTNHWQLLSFWWRMLEKAF